MLQGLLCFKLG